MVLINRYCSLLTTYFSNIEEGFTWFLILERRQKDQHGRVLHNGQHEDQLENEVESVPAVDHLYAYFLDVSFINLLLLMDVNKVKNLYCYIFCIALMV